MKIISDGLHKLRAKAIYQKSKIEWRLGLRPVNRYRMGVTSGHLFIYLLICLFAYFIKCCCLKGVCWFGQLNQKIGIDASTRELTYISLTSKTWWGWVSSMFRTFTLD